MAKRIGNSTIKFEKPPCICSYAAVGGKKESEGPLGREFDKTFKDDTLGEKSWEKSESLLIKESITLAINKAGVEPSQVDCIVAGDLLNQCTGSTYGIRPFGVPFLGVYGACSTMAESLVTGSMLIESGAASRCICATSSHFCSSERQFRYPLEYGGQRPPTAQWTVTGSGAVMLTNTESKIRITEAVIGKIIDVKVKDANNMGAAMSGAAADTIKAYFDDTHESIDKFDMIATGDLGYVGMNLNIELLKKQGIVLGDKYTDCGMLIYDREKQQVESGGSGCGCSASVLCARILRNMEQGNLKDVLFIATGALMSTTSVQQGESIPGIAHLIRLQTN